MEQRHCSNLLAKCECWSVAVTQPPTSMELEVSFWALHWQASLKSTRPGGTGRVSLGERNPFMRKGWNHVTTIWITRPTAVACSLNYSVILPSVYHKIAVFESRSTQLSPWPKKHIGTRERHHWKLGAVWGWDPFKMCLRKAEFGNLTAC